LIAADAMYRAGVAWEKQADKAEYDQNAAGQAIAAYTDFTVVFPDDKRVATAQAAITKLKAEQVRGSFQIAQFYEKGHRWNAAIIYYDDVRQLDPTSPLAEQAQQRIYVLRQRLQPATTAQPAPAPQK
jgi:outer membrane protein assembly factor BamD (BamD/ComL family)